MLKKTKVYSIILLFLIAVSAGRVSTGDFSPSLFGEEKLFSNDVAIMVMLALPTVIRWSVKYDLLDEERGSDLTQKVKSINSVSGPSMITASWAVDSMCKLANNTPLRRLASPGLN